MLGLLNQKLFKRFKEKYPQFQDMSFDQFEQIIVTFNGEIWQTAIDNRDGVELPEGLGSIFIGTCKAPRVRRNPDYKKSRELGKVVAHKNWESEGRLAKIFYTNYRNGKQYGLRHGFRGRELWNFSGVRQFTRAVSASYPSQWTKYMVIENMRNIAKLFKRTMAKDFAIKITKEFDYSKYNEFDMP